MALFVVLQEFIQKLILSLGFIFVWGSAVQHNYQKPANSFETSAKTGSYLQFRYSVGAQETQASTEPQKALDMWRHCPEPPES